MFVERLAICIKCGEFAAKVPSSYRHVLYCNKCGSIVQDPSEK